ncbi:DNA ligase 1 [Pancytospora epiphaga]|nr:DNA ligase 1 [Pancytospora epiphaga]
MAGDTAFLELCNLFENIANTTKRLEIQSMLSSFLEKLASHDPESLAPSLFLCSASIYPQHYNTELGIGEHSIQTIVAEATGFTVKTLKQKYVKTGDLGRVAMENRIKQLFPVLHKLSIVDVLQRLRDIAEITGKNSANGKKNIMLSLITASSPLEAKYLVRLFETKLKIGLASQTVLISLGIAFHNIKNNKIESSKEGDNTAEHAIQCVKEAFNKHADYEHLVKLIMKHGIENLPDVCTVSPGVPLKPMLAQPSKNLTKAFAKVENMEFVAEYKYDGERVQIHNDGTTIKIFSRNSEDITVKYPDIAMIRPSEKPFIVDGEVVAYKNGEIQSFQLLSTRKRKNTKEIDVKVCVFAFDVLYFDGEELLGRPLRERIKILHGNFAKVDDTFMFANSSECKSVEEIDGHFKEAIQNSCEGVMIKSLDSPYHPSLRSNSWVKIKKDYLESLGDSMDLVVMGAFYGKGKRTGSYGGFLLGVYNEEAEKYEACCKIGTGFSDEVLKYFYEKLGAIVTVDASEYIYRDGLEPDRWMSPTYVWEVKAASLSLSPVYSAGKWDNRGISLRFPRFVREREDKNPQDATTSNQILRMYLENTEKETDDEYN